MGPGSELEPLIRCFIVNMICFAVIPMPLAIEIGSCAKFPSDAQRSKIDKVKLYIKDIKASGDVALEAPRAEP